ncbi:G protein-activated inward rectifier potassium channel 2-like isoform X2 [Artemia franciscana]|uniref:G protein-activated inward rectifier potassium channel 2-like isoform X2 n=1 Tax=Artemia franciscana TaxID=6661 RepID=UPI0032DB7B89
MPKKTSTMRVVSKNGDCNVESVHLSTRRFTDLFTTLVDAKWRWSLGAFAFSFFLSWTTFAFFWWLQCFLHGDLEPDNLPDGVNQISGNFTPCVANMYHFGSAMLYSIATQHTIGYGFRYPTNECMTSIIILSCQAMTGLLVEAIMVGVFFAKLTRPKNRAQTVRFSKKAVICERNGFLCLVFRIGDIKKSRIINATVTAEIIRKKVNPENGAMEFIQEDLEVVSENGRNSFFFVWPIQVFHKITPSSPLYRISPKDLEKEEFEVVVILEGTAEATGSATQAKSSYIPSEILWGYKFKNMVTWSKDKKCHVVDYKVFNEVYPVSTTSLVGFNSSENMYNYKDGSTITTIIDSKESLSSLIYEKERTKFEKQNGTVHL